MASSSRYRVALTGTRTFLGERLIAALEADPDCEHVTALDIRPPRSARTKTRFSRLDLTDPSSDETAARLLVDEGADVLVHLAFLSKPSHSSSWAHELEAIGSLYAMNAAAEAKVGKVILGSTTAVYGAHPMNPMWIEEDAPLRGIKASRWVMDKVSAERELARLARDCPDIACTSLRFAMTVGPTIDGYWANTFRRPTMTLLMGYDPLMQFTHEDDAVGALLAAIRGEQRGAFNIAGSGTLYLTQILKLGAKVPIPVPHVFGYPLHNALFNLQIVETPGTFLNYFRYAWVTDTKRMVDVLGFEPEHSSKEALMALLDASAAATKGGGPPPHTTGGAP